MDKVEKIHASAMKQTLEYLERNKGLFEKLIRTIVEDSYMHGYMDGVSSGIESARKP